MPRADNRYIDPILGWATAPHQNALQRMAAATHWRQPHARLCAPAPTDHPRLPERHRDHAHHGLGPGLPQQTDSPGGAVHARWLHRHSGQSDRTRIGQSVERIGGGRERPRCGRLHRCGPSRQGRTRRLHPADGPHWDIGGQPKPLSQTALQPAQRLCSGGMGGQRTQCVGTAPGHQSELDERVCGFRQIQSWSTELRIGWQW